MHWSELMPTVTAAAHDTVPFNIALMLLSMHSIAGVSVTLCYILAQVTPAPLH